jgi:hypothetical protein
MLLNRPDTVFLYGTFYCNSSSLVWVYQLAFEICELLHLRVVRNRAKVNTLFVSINYEFQLRVDLRINKHPSWIFIVVIAGIFHSASKVGIQFGSRITPGSLKIVLFTGPNSSKVNDNCMQFVDNKQL